MPFPRTSGLVRTVRCRWVTERERDRLRADIERAPTAASAACERAGRPLRWASAAACFKAVALGVRSAVRVASAFSFRVAAARTSRRFFPWLGDRPRLNVPAGIF